MPPVDSPDELALIPAPRKVLNHRLHGGVLGALITEGRPNLQGHDVPLIYEPVSHLSSFAPIRWITRHVKIVSSE
jgi:hypothetical protein